MSKLKIGDTIQCRDNDELIYLMTALEKEGYRTDFDYSQDKVRIVILDNKEVEENESRE